MKSIYTLILFISLTSCSSIHRVSFQTDEDPAALDYFKIHWDVPYLKNNYFINSPEQCFFRIRHKIPEKWWRYAIEGLYYHLPTTAKIQEKEKWLDLAAKILPSDNVQAFRLMIRGMDLSEQGNYDDAINCLNTSYNLSKKLNQHFRANDAKRYMARCFLAKGEYVVAANLTYEVYDFLKDKSISFHQDRKFETLILLVQIYLFIGAPRKALRWARQCHYYVQHSGNSPGQLIQVTEKMAEVFLSLNRPDSSWFLLNKSQNLRHQFNINYNINNGSFLLGKTLLRLKQPSKALPFLKQVDSKNLELDNYQKTIEIKISIAECMKLLGKPDSSISYFQQALQHNYNPSLKLEINQHLADLYALKGQFKMAFYHHKSAYFISKDLFSPTKNLAFGEVTSQFTSLRQKEHIEQINKYNSYRYLDFYLSIFFIAIVVIFYYSIRHIKNKQLKLATIQYPPQVMEDLSNNQLLLKKESELVELQLLVTIKNNLIAQLEQKIKIPELEVQKMPLRMLTEADWLEFKMSFEKQFPGYFDQLQSQFSGLTNSELRLFLFVKIGLDNKSIADISGISIESVYRNRTRLRNKLGLDRTAKLEDFIEAF
jgi:tetratricopeptide (TPR) repeat protein/DNA-binding CsgD family transcriptional regulator